MDALGYIGTPAVQAGCMYGRKMIKKALLGKIIPHLESRQPLGGALAEGVLAGHHELGPPPSEMYDSDTDGGIMVRLAWQVSVSQPLAPPPPGC